MKNLSVGMKNLVKEIAALPNGMCVRSKYLHVGTATALVTRGIAYVDKSRIPRFVCLTESGKALAASLKEES